MHRREFLRALLALPIAAELDVERLLWVPHQSVFIPAPGPITVDALEWSWFGLTEDATDAFIRPGEYFGLSRTFLKPQPDQSSDVWVNRP